jgi:hypothetical protein
MVLKLTTSTTKHRATCTARHYILKNCYKVILCRGIIFAVIILLNVSNIIVIFKRQMRIQYNDVKCFDCYTEHHMALNYRHFPRIIYLLSTDKNPIPTLSLEGSNITWKRHVTDMGNIKARRRIAQRDDLDLDSVEDDRCQLRSNWQRMSFPTCNIVHEFDSTQPWSSTSSQMRRQKTYRIIGNGFWRDVWIVNYESRGIQSNERGIFKTMRYQHSYSPRNFDRMRRDSVTMERLTKSPFIIDIFAFCGTSSLSEFGDGGDIPDALWPTKTNVALTPIQKLRIGTLTHRLY